MNTALRGLTRGATAAIFVAVNMATGHAYQPLGELARDRDQGVIWTTPCAEWRLDANERVQRGETEFPPMDPYPAAGAFTVCLRTPQRPTAVRWEPESRAIEWSWRDGILTAVIPGLHIHGVLLVE